MAKQTYVLKGNLSYGTFTFPDGKHVALDSDGSYEASADEARILDSDPVSPFKRQDSKKGGDS